MRKIQILFPDPLMRRLRALAKAEDQPVSEIVRRATERWLDQRTYVSSADPRLALPRFHGGKIKIASERLREAAYSDR